MIVELSFYPLKISSVKMFMGIAKCVYDIRGLRNGKAKNWIKTCTTQLHSVRTTVRHVYIVLRQLWRRQAILIGSCKSNLCTCSGFERRRCLRGNIIQCYRYASVWIVLKDVHEPLRGSAPMVWHEAINLQLSSLSNLFITTSASNDVAFMNGSQMW